MKRTLKVKWHEHNAEPINSTEALSVTKRRFGDTTIADILDDTSFLFLSICTDSQYIHIREITPPSMTKVPLCSKCHRPAEFYGYDGHDPRLYLCSLHYEEALQAAQERRQLKVVDPNPSEKRGGETMNERQEEIMDATGADEWNWIIEAYSGKSAAQIEEDLNRMFPHSDNQQLAENIYAELSS